MEYSYTHGKPLQNAPEIAQCQQKLNIVRETYHGQWNKLATDGLFGRNTRDAVRQYQIFDNLSVNGKLDTPTQNALEAKYKESQLTYSHYSIPPTNYQLANANYTVAPTGQYADWLRDQVKSPDFKWDSDWLTFTKDILSIAGTIVEETGKEIAKAVYSNGADNKKIYEVASRIFKKYEPRMAEILKQYNHLIKKLDEALNTTQFLEDFKKSGMAPEHYIDPSGKKVSVADTINESRNASNALRKQSQKALKKVTDVFKGPAAMRALKHCDKIGYVINICVIIYFGRKYSTATSDYDAKVYKQCMDEAIANLVSDIVFDASVGLAVGGVATAVGGVAGAGIMILFSCLDFIVVPLTGKSCSTWFTEGQATYIKLADEAWAPKDGDSMWTESMKNLGRARALGMRH